MIYFQYLYLQKEQLKEEQDRLLLMQAEANFCEEFAKAFLSGNVDISPVHPFTCVLQNSKNCN